eukprot:TRINITY_DN2201_c0_g1_i10.p2 TRINITY_DN2201_c0_g1~~TRINITY_DN2201_c0_g1_i10.p2  ORF type:complete len:217 (-),score=-10.81 TRINITY_DN2201_c0_g1_i10:1303-1953(-)
MSQADSGREKTQFVEERKLDLSKQKVFKIHAKIIFTYCFIGFLIYFVICFGGGGGRSQITEDCQIYQANICVYSMTFLVGGPEVTPTKDDNSITQLFFGLQRFIKIRNIGCIVSVQIAIMPSLIRSFVQVYITQVYRPSQDNRILCRIVSEFDILYVVNPFQIFVTIISSNSITGPSISLQDNLRESIPVTKQTSSNGIKVCMYLTKYTFTHILMI